ncbi:MAG: ribonuclease P protein component [Pseudomonadota bacterium]
MLNFTTLKSRFCFTNARKANTKFVGTLIVVQTATKSSCQLDANPQEAVIGFTVSKKIGKAVTRNLVKRQLRHVCRLLNHQQIAYNNYYVIIARSKILDASFSELTQEIINGFTWLAKKQRQ